MEGLSAMLAGMGIAQGPAEAYAAALVEDGFDTEIAFNTLSLLELKEEFGFKRGHLRMVEQAREPMLLGRAVSLPATLGGMPSDDAPKLAAADSTDALPRLASDGTKDELQLALLQDVFGPERTIFASMRFPVPPEARALAEALKAHRIFLKIVDLRPGADISTEVFAWIEYSHTFLVFGTHNYGEETGNPASSCAECKYAQNMNKRMILLRMIPWDQHFEHLQARVVFGMNKLTLFWEPGTPLPADVVPQIVDALDPANQQAECETLTRIQSIPQLTGSVPASQALAAQQLSSASDLASSCGSSVEELVGLTSAELKEVMKEQEDSGMRIGILGRKRILTEVARLQSSGSITPRSPPARDLDDDVQQPEPEPEVDRGDDEVDEEWDEEPDIMLIGDEEHVIMLSFLDLPDLARMARVSRHWRTLISDDFFWEQKYSWSRYPCAPPTTVTPCDGSLPEGVLSYRAAFRRRAMWWSLPGLCIEVLDTYNIWSVARVLLVLDENHLLIWFEGWGDEWLMWLDRRFDLARVRPCGSEVAGLGKRGPIDQGTLIAKQAQAIEMILDAPSQHTAQQNGVFFPDSNVWKQPECSPSQGVQPSCYCRGWMEDQNRPEDQRTFTKEWRDMEDPGRVVVGGARDSPLEGFDTWHSALTRNPSRPSEVPNVPAIGSENGPSVPPVYVVANAGVERCNGNYTLRPETRDQVPCWANENDIMLLRYQLPSGNRYWYLADLHDLTSGRGDFYRARSDEERPVFAGWSIAGCAAGVEPCPTITLPAPAVAVALDSTQTVRVGQKLEAQDLQYPSLTCAATVKSVAETPAGIEIGVTFDGWGDQYDYTELLSFDGFHPVGWSARNGNTMQAPGSQVQAPAHGWSEPFDWRGYLARTRATAVDAALLTASTTRRAVDDGSTSGGTAGGVRLPTQSATTVGDAWASQQQAAMRRRPWLSCSDVSNQLARRGAQADLLPLPLQQVSTTDAEQGEAEAPWYHVIAGAELRRSWQPDSAVLGSLEPREVVQVIEIVTGQRHFPTEIGVLDLRAMARCDKGWFECRSRTGASAVRPADPPR